MKLLLCAKESRFPSLRVVREKVKGRHRVRATAPIGVMFETPPKSPRGGKIPSQGMFLQNCRVTSPYERR